MFSILKTLRERREVMSKESDEGLFTKDKQEKFKKWIKDKLGHDLECDCCGSKGWAMMEEIFTFVRFPTKYLSSRKMPSVIVVCDNCGNTKLFNAVMIGIVGWK